MSNEVDQFWMRPDCLEGPSWRWNRAQRLPGQNRRERLAEVDQLTKRAAEYVSTMGQGPSGASLAAQRDPILDGAVGLWKNQELSQQLQVLTIAGCPQQEIAGRLGIDQQVVAAAQELFFDIRARLTATGWITCHVILPLVRSGAADLAAKLKLAFYGGPDAARAMLDARVRVLAKEADRLFDRELLLHLKAQEALDVPLEGGQQLEFLKLYLQYDIRRQRLELDKQKFAQRCGQAQPKSEPERQSQQGAAGDPQSESGQQTVADGQRDIDLKLRVAAKDRSSHRVA